MNCRKFQYRQATDAKSRCRLSSYGAFLDRLHHMGLTTRRFNRSSGSEPQYGELRAVGAGSNGTAEQSLALKLAIVLGQVYHPS